MNAALVPADPPPTPPDPPPVSQLKMLYRAVEEIGDCMYHLGLVLLQDPSTNNGALRGAIAGGLEKAASFVRGSPYNETVTLDFDYTNYRGIRSRRKATVLSLRWGTSKWYPKAQWLVKCYDLKKGEVREFAWASMEIVNGIPTE